MKQLSKLAINVAIASIIITGVTYSQGTHVYAQANKETYTPAQVVLDGVLQEYAQPAVIQNGYTLVPLRAIFESLGAEVEWEPTTRTVTATKGETTIELTINEAQAYVDGKAITLAVKAQTINSHTMVPLRFVSEALGAEVGFDNTTRTVTIKSVGVATERPNPSQMAGDIIVLYGR